MVLPNGKIANVNEHSYPDLYFALRGGGNNFGIVTRFDLITFPQGDLWGGQRLHSISTNTSIFAAFNNFATNSDTDVDAALIASAVFYEGEYLYALDVEYAKPLVNPPIFHEFSDIPSFSSSMRITNLTDLTTELNVVNPNSFREKWASFTVRNSPVLQSKILDIFVEENNVVAETSGLLNALVMSPVTASTISKFSQRGGNALGISVSDAPLILVGLSIRWLLSSDDASINRMADNIVGRSVAVAKEMGLDNRYIYQNYGSSDQDVFAGYGEENLAKLRAVSRKYDPKGVFQKLQPGYFKLGGL